MLTPAERKLIGLGYERIPSHDNFTDLFKNEFADRLGVVKIGSQGSKRQYVFIGGSRNVIPVAELKAILELIEEEYGA